MSSKTSVGTESMIGFSRVKTMGGIFFINRTKWNCGFLRIVSFLCKTEQQYMTNYEVVQLLLVLIKVWELLRSFSGYSLVYHAAWLLLPWVSSQDLLHPQAVFIMAFSG